MSTKQREWLLWENVKNNILQLNTYKHNNISNPTSGRNTKFRHSFFEKVGLWLFLSANAKRKKTCQYIISKETLTKFSPLSPKSDQHEISPYYINASENRVVMRIGYMIRKEECNWYFKKSSPLLLLKKYRDSKWESQFWSQGLKG